MKFADYGFFLLLFDPYDRRADGRENERNLITTNDAPHRNPDYSDEGQLYLCLPLSDAAFS